MPEVLDRRRAEARDAELVKPCKCTILFVCTGNTCRSPLAEALCKKLLAEQLDCTLTELPERGYQVLSAGLAAVSGAAASREALVVAKEYGVDLAGHLSQQVTEDLIMHANYVVAMTRTHVRFLETLQLPHAPLPQLLATDGSDIIDPIGGDEAEYRACARQIFESLQQLLPRFQQKRELPDSLAGEGR